MPLWIKCSSPFVAPRHPHLRAPPHVCCHVCHTHARPCLCTGWALNRRFDLTFGTATVLAQGGGGVGGTMGRLSTTECTYLPTYLLELGQFGSPNSKGVSKGCAWGLFGGNIV